MRRKQPLSVVIIGPPNSGKSTLAYSSICDRKSEGGRVGLRKGSSREFLERIKAEIEQSGTPHATRGRFDELPLVYTSQFLTLDVELVEGPGEFSERLLDVQRTNKHVAKHVEQLERMIPRSDAVLLLVDAIESVQDPTSTMVVCALLYMCGRLGCPVQLVLTKVDLLHQPCTPAGIRADLQRLLAEKTDATLLHQLFGNVQSSPQVEVSMATSFQAHEFWSLDEDGTARWQGLTESVLGFRINDPAACRLNPTHLLGLRALIQRWHRYEVDGSKTRFVLHSASVDDTGRARVEIEAAGSPSVDLEHLLDKSVLRVTERWTLRLVVRLAEVSPAPLSPEELEGLGCTFPSGLPQVKLRGALGLVLSGWRKLQADAHFEFGSGGFNGRESTVTLELISDAAPPGHLSELAGPGWNLDEVGASGLLTLWIDADKVQPVEDDEVWERQIYPLIEWRASGTSDFNGCVDVRENYAPPLASLIERAAQHRSRRRRARRRRVCLVSMLLLLVGACLLLELSRRHQLEIARDTTRPLSERWAALSQPTLLWRLLVWGDDERSVVRKELEREKFRQASRVPAFEPEADPLGVLTRYEHATRDLPLPDPEAGAFLQAALSEARSAAAQAWAGSVRSRLVTSQSAGFDAQWSTLAEVALETSREVTRLDSASAPVIWEALEAPLEAGVESLVRSGRAELDRLSATARNDWLDALEERTRTRDESWPSLSRALNDAVSSLRRQHEEALCAAWEAEDPAGHLPLTLRDAVSSWQDFDALQNELARAAPPPQLIERVGVTRAALQAAVQEALRRALASLALEDIHRVGTVGELLGALEATSCETRALRESYRVKLDGVARQWVQAALDGGWSGLDEAVDLLGRAPTSMDEVRRAAIRHLEATVPTWLEGPSSRASWSEAWSRLAALRDRLLVLGEQAEGLKELVEATIERRVQQGHSQLAAIADPQERWERLLEVEGRPHALLSSLRQRTVSELREVFLEAQRRLEEADRDRTPTPNWRSEQLELARGALQLAARHLRLEAPPLSALARALQALAEEHTRDLPLLDVELEGLVGLCLPGRTWSVTSTRRGERLLTASGAGEGRAAAYLTPVEEPPQDLLDRVEPGVQVSGDLLLDGAGTICGGLRRLEVGGHAVTLVMLSDRAGVRARLADSLQFRMPQLRVRPTDVSASGRWELNVVQEGDCVASLRSSQVMGSEVVSLQLPEFDPGAPLVLQLVERDGETRSELFPMPAVHASRQRLELTHTALQVELRRSP